MQGLGVAWGVVLCSHDILRCVSLLSRVLRYCIDVLLLLFFFLPDLCFLFLFFFFNDPATPEISPLPLHAALPISSERQNVIADADLRGRKREDKARARSVGLGFDMSAVEDLFAADRLQHKLIAPVFVLSQRSEEHTSELQSRSELGWRLLLGKKKI